MAGTVCIIVYFLQPVVYNAAGLVIGLLSLLSSRPPLKHPLVTSSPLLCAAVLLWQLACYTATALAPMVLVPGLARSLGLLVYAPGGSALGFLLAQLAAALTLAALARAPRHRYLDPPLLTLNMQEANTVSTSLVSSCAAQWSLIPTTYTHGMHSQRFSCGQLCCAVLLNIRTCLEQCQHLLCV